jgi:hypothetical protein
MLPSSDWSLPELDIVLSRDLAQLMVNIGGSRDLQGDLALLIRILNTVLR